MFLVPLLKQAAKQPKSTPTKQPKSDKQHKSSKTAANQLYILTQTKRKIWKHQAYENLFIIRTEGALSLVHDSRFSCSPVCLSVVRNAPREIVCAIICPRFRKYSSMWHTSRQFKKYLSDLTNGPKLFFSRQY